MTPTQLTAFAAVVRLGSVKAAAAELDVTESAVSMHIKSLRTELSDRLFVRSKGGIAFTPGGLRLATRANELLGLQDQTKREVRDAADGASFGFQCANGLLQFRLTLPIADFVTARIARVGLSFQSLPSKPPRGWSPSAG